MKKWFTSRESPALLPGRLTGFGVLIAAMIELSSDRRATSQSVTMSDGSKRPALPQAARRALCRTLACGALILLIATGGLPLHAQSLPAIKVDLPDGRIASIDEVPGVKRRLVRYLESRQKTERGSVYKSPMAFTLYGSPSFCPAEYRDWYYPLGITSPVNSLTSQLVEEQCNQALRLRLVDYDEPARQRCRCVRLMENRALWEFNLRIVSDVAIDPFTYSTMTLVHTRGTAREALRGFAAFSDTEMRLYNAARQLVCSGPSSDGAPATALTCFGGRLKATGSFRSMKDDALGFRRGGYWLGAYRLANGERIDIATDLTDSELKQRHPNFPD